MLSMFELLKTYVGKNIKINITYTIPIADSRVTHESFDSITGYLKELDADKGIMHLMPFFEEDEIYKRQLTIKDHYIAFASINSITEEIVYK